MGPVRLETHSDVQSSSDSLRSRRGCELASVLQALESLRAKLILWCNNGLAGGDGMGMANGGMVMRARGDAAPIGTAR